MKRKERTCSEGEDVSYTKFSDGKLTYFQNFVIIQDLPLVTRTISGIVSMSAATASRLYP